MKKKRKKSLVGWTEKNWKTDWSSPFSKNPQYASMSAVRKLKGKIKDNVKIRITIEEI